MRIRVAAPSLTFEAFAAVIVPFLVNAGFRDGNFSGTNF
jgi:hypothetical protein